MLFSEHVLERQHSQRHLCGNKGADWHHFPPPPLSINTEPVGSSAVLTLIAYIKPHPAALQQKAFLSHIYLSQRGRPLPLNTTQNPATPRLLTREFYMASFLVEVVESLISQADRALLDIIHPIQVRDQSLSTVGKESICRQLA